MAERGSEDEKEEISRCFVSDNPLALNLNYPINPTHIDKSNEKCEPQAIE